MFNNIYVFLGKMFCFELRSKLNRRYNVLVNEKDNLIPNSFRNGLENLSKGLY